MVRIEVDQEAPPFVLGIRTILRRSAADPKLNRRLGKMRGVLGLRSSVDPQVATVTFDRGTITLSGADPAGAHVVITLDPNDASAKPKVSGVAKHLGFALHVAKVMEPPAGSWQQEAQAFWDFAAAWPRMPSGLRVVCTDDGEEHTFGDGPATYEIHGSAAALVSVFTGSSILGQDALEGKLCVVGSIEHISILTGRSIAWAMGAGR